MKVKLYILIRTVFFMITNWLSVGIWKLVSSLERDIKVTLQISCPRLTFLTGLQLVMQIAMYSTNTILLIWGIWL